MLEFLYENIEGTGISVRTPLKEDDEDWKDKGVLSNFD